MVNYSLIQSKNALRITNSRYLLLLGCFWLGCEQLPESESTLAKGEKPFFDLKGFFRQEINQLDSLQPRLRKTVRLDGSEETKILDTLDYDSELQVFLDSDINRIAWIDRYSTDSIRRARRLQRLVYRAKSEDLKTKLLAITFDSAGEVDLIRVRNNADSPTYQLEQRLRYKVDSGFVIQTRQEITLSPAKKMYVGVAFDGDGQR